MMSGFTTAIGFWALISASSVHCKDRLPTVAKFSTCLVAAASSNVVNAMYLGTTVAGSVQMVFWASRTEATATSTVFGFAFAYSLVTSIPDRPNSMPASLSLAAMPKP